MDHSEKTTDRLQRLLESSNWTEEERQWLLFYLDTTSHPELHQIMKERFTSDQPQHISHTEAERILGIIHQRTAKPAPVVFFRKNLKRMVVAASVILMASTFTFIYLDKGQKHSNAINSNNHHTLVNDAAPGHDNATLTLDDGTTIVLDNASNGTLAKQGNTKVQKKDSEVSYIINAATPDQSAYNAIVYNTISTARGNQYRLQLSDGSKVWLNAASSIRFPASFAGNERRVEITGEVYFEVAPLSPLRTGTGGPKGGHGKVPFIVQVNTPSEDGDMEVQVLGTHFNIKAYDDESEIKTTLLEGLVKVKKGSAAQILSPGQQSVINTNGKMIVSENIDVLQTVAWKDGYFWFNNTDLADMMKQLARWYDIEVEYKGVIKEDGFSGKIPRNIMLSSLLKILELNDVHFRIEGKKLTVLP